MLPWVKNVKVTMSAQPARPIFAGQLPSGLQTISNIVAVSSCKVDPFGGGFLLSYADLIMLTVYQCSDYPFQASKKFLFGTFFLSACPLPLP